MRLFSLNACTRVVAVALLVASAFSAGMSHAHPGGDLAHDHHSGRLNSASAGVEQASAEFQLFAEQSHMHVYLLGFEFTVPAEEKSNDDSSPGSDQMISRLVGDDFDTSPSAAATDWLATPGAAQLSAPAVAESSDCATSVIAVVSAPLCDSARHERTGVLRI